MRVIGAGLPRTGTLSQKVALEMLGLTPCYHMVNVLADLGESPRWGAALDGTGSVAEIVAGAEATVDWPGSFFYQELAEAYPDAKVVLSTRDGEGWAESMRSTVWGLFYDDCLIRHLSDARGFVDPAWKSFMTMMRGLWERSGVLEGSGFGMTNAALAAGMERHNAAVQAAIDPDRLLVWSVREGWEPLCDFLELPVPDVPFPRVNDGKEFVRRIIDQAIAVIGQHSAAELALEAAAADA